MDAIEEIIEMRIQHIKNDFDYDAEINLAHAEKARAQYEAMKADIDILLTIFSNVQTELSDRDLTLAIELERKYKHGCY